MSTPHSDGAYVGAVPKVYETLLVPLIFGYCQGTPLRAEIEARDATGLERVTKVAAEAIAQRFGRGAVDAKLQAHVVTVDR